VVLEDPRGSARQWIINEFKELTRLRWLQWRLTLRSIATEWMLSLELNENVFSLSDLRRN